jgi:hypothetical protein
MAKINERGSHTTVIEQAVPLLKEMKKLEVLVSPGIIEVIRSAKSKTAKFKKINNELLELVVTAGSSKQSFKVFGGEQKSILLSLKNNKKLSDWNVGYIDTSKVGD